jgi:cytochrome c5
MLRGLAFLLLLSLGACSYDNAEELLERQPPAACDSTAVTYALTISPLLDANCRDCHNQAVPVANINLEGYEQTKRYADNGLLVGVVTHAKGFSPMPKDGARLSDCDISCIKAWVAAGALNN